MRVDILLSTYNGEDFIEELINSILNQTYSNWHLLIRDDGSIDNTINIINNLIEKNSGKITLINPTKRHNIGPKKSFSSLIEHSESELVFFCDQDDIWMNTKIEEHVNNYISCKNNYIPFLQFSDCYITDDKLNILSESYFKYMGRSPEKIKFNNLLIQNVILGCVCSFNRKLIDLVKSIPDEAVVHDWWVALTASGFGKISFINKPLIYYRQHAKNVIGAQITLNYFKRLKKLFPWEDNTNYKNNFNKIINQAEKFNSIFGLKLSNKKKFIINNFLLIPTFSFIKRIFHIFMNKFQKATLVENLELIFRYKINK